MPGPPPGYELEFEDTFDADRLDERLLVPYYLPQWSSRERTTARYEVGDGSLRLLIEADTEPWAPELDGDLKVSSLQTGVFAGPVGSSVGQLRFSDAVVVREPQENVRLYTPQYGWFEVRMKAIADPRAMVAFWMIGYEDEPDRSGEICIAEIFGRDVEPGRAKVGMGIHPFHDPRLTEEWVQEPFDVDATEYHVYAADWTPDHVAFFVDGEHVKTVGQSPSYPMQFMLNVYELPGDGETSYPRVFTVDYVRGYRASAGRPDPDDPDSAA
jgi:hypothetical protein